MWCNWNNVAVAMENTVAICMGIIACSWCMFNRLPMINRITITCYCNQQLHPRMAQTPNTSPKFPNCYLKLTAMRHGTMSIGSECCWSCWNMSLAGCASLLSWAVVRPPLHGQSPHDCQLGSVELLSQNLAESLSYGLYNGRNKCCICNGHCALHHCI